MAGHEEGPRHLLLTPRMCADLREVFERAEYDGSEHGWERVRTALDTGMKSKSGTRLELVYVPGDAKEHILDLMKIVAGTTFHKKLSDALRIRIDLLNAHLGVSAVDRLGELM